MGPKELLLDGQQDLAFGWIVPQYQRLTADGKWVSPDLGSVGPAMLGVYNRNF